MSRQILSPKRNVWHLAMRELENAMQSIETHKGSSQDKGHPIKKHEFREHDNALKEMLYSARTLLTDVLLNGEKAYGNISAANEILVNAFSYTEHLANSKDHLPNLQDRYSRMPKNDGATSPIQQFDQHLKKERKESTNIQNIFELLFEIYNGKDENMQEFATELSTNLDALHTNLEDVYARNDVKQEAAGELIMDIIYRHLQRHLNSEPRDVQLRMMMAPDTSHITTQLMSKDVLPVCALIVQLLTEIFNHGVNRGGLTKDDFEKINGIASCLSNITKSDRDLDVLIDLSLQYADLLQQYNNLDGSEKEHVSNRMDLLLEHFQDVLDSLKKFWETTEENEKIKEQIIQCISSRMTDIQRFSETNAVFRRREMPELYKLDNSYVAGAVYDIIQMFERLHRTKDINLDKFTELNSLQQY